ncbi:MAG: mechanosensitive ion channel family protein [Pseudohongiellaceae bacterium]
MESSLALIETYVIPWSIKIALALLILVAGNMLARMVTRFVTQLMQKARVDAILVKFLSNIFYVLLLIAVAVAAIDSLGVNVASLLTIVGAAGLAVGLALKDSLSNFAAGVMLIVFRPFKTGDFVTAAGVSGVVDEIGMFSTLLHTTDNQRIVVPNSGVINGVIVNASALPTRRIDLLVSISYDDNIARAKELISGLVLSDPRVLKDPQLTIGVGELASSSVDLFVRPWVKTEDYWAVRPDLIEKIKSALEEAGFTIPYPQQDVYMHHIDEKK